MEKTKLFKLMTEAVLKGNKEEVKSLAIESLAMGIPPEESIEEGFSLGITQAGILWEEGEYFLPEVIMSSEAMKTAVDILKSKMENKNNKTSSKGTVIIGTIEGDIHDIGKTLVASLLTASGFTVIDLGVDVPVEKFIKSAQENSAHIIGMSALLTTTMAGQKKLIEKLKSEGIREQFKVLVGGAPVSHKWAEEIGADAAPANAVEAVKTVQKILNIPV